MSRSRIASSVDTLPGRDEKGKPLSRKWSGCKPHGGAGQFTRHAAYEIQRSRGGLSACRKNSLGVFRRHRRGIFFKAWLRARLPGLRVRRGIAVQRERGRGQVLGQGGAVVFHSAGNVRQIARKYLTANRADLRYFGETFPERVVEEIRIAGLPSDAPELFLSQKLAQYGEAIRTRTASLPLQEAGYVRLTFVGLQQRLLSSIAAFAKTLEVHAASARRRSHNGLTGPPPIHWRADRHRGWLDQPESACRRAWLSPFARPKYPDAHSRRRGGSSTT